MKIAITGGHLTPALAVIKVLQQDKKNKIFFYGRKYTFDGDSTLSLEYQTIKKMKIPFREVRAGKIKRHLTKDALASLARVPRGYFESQKKIDRDQPDILLSFGGFLAVPVALACKRRGIPIVTHEQTQSAGLSNKVIGKIADEICISFPASQSEFPKSKTSHTGNPIRPEIFKIDKKIHIPKGQKMLYVTGGSSGAHALNRLIGNSLPKLLSYWVVIHQTGDTKLTGDYEHLQQIRGELSTDRKERYIIKKFTATDEIGWIYKNADIVVGRAGVNTVLELMATGTKALLFPLAAGQKDEQLKNAKMYAESGLGEYLTHIPQSNEFVSHLKKLSQKAKKSVKLDTIHKEAAAKIADIVIKTYEKKRKEAA